MNATAAETEDLEALFDRIAAQSEAARGQAGATDVAAGAGAQTAGPDPGTSAPSAPSMADPDGGRMFNRVGQLTRTLHDALRELGYDRNLESAVQNLPDARDRLNYIATLTGQAAERALGAVEAGQALQKALAEDSNRLALRWQELCAGALSVEEFKALAGQTREYFGAMPGRAGEINAQFHEIMMAQDFHDLTGQVIGRVIALAQSLEDQLVTLLIETRPIAAPGSQPQWLSGPAIKAAERSDVVANQAQVDELLERLGF